MVTYAFFIRPLVAPALEIRRERLGFRALEPNPVKCNRTCYRC